MKESEEEGVRGILSQSTRSVRKQCLLEKAACKTITVAISTDILRWKVKSLRGPTIDKELKAN